MNFNLNGRRDFLGTVAALPFFNPIRGASRTPSHDFISSAALTTLRTCHTGGVLHTLKLLDVLDNKAHTSDFGVVFYVDPRGIFIDANV